MTEPAIVEPRPEHLPAVLHLMNREIAEHAAHFGTEPQSLAELEAQVSGDYPFYVAVDGDRVVGFAYASPWKTRAAYQWTAELTVYVDRERTGQQIGERLGRALVSALQARGFAMVIGGIALPNAAAVALVERAGMRYVGTFEKVGFKHGKWRSVGYWQMALRPQNDEPSGVQERQQELPIKGGSNGT